MSMPNINNYPHRRSGRANSVVVRSRTNGKACYTCHRRKVRCDILSHGVPCSNCQTHGTPDCRIYIRQPSRRATARASSSTASNSHRNLSSRQVTLTPATQSPLGHPTAPYPTPAEQGLDSGDASAEVLASTSQEEEEAPLPSSRRGAQDASSSDEEPDANHLSEFLSHDEARGREISFATRMYFIGTEFSTLNHLVRQRAQPADQGILHFGSQPHAPRRPEVPAECLRLPGKKLCRELIDAYFSLVNDCFPIVHQEAFMASYNNDNKDDESPSSPLILNCILFAGAHALGPTKPEVGRLAPQFYRRARQLFAACYDPARENYIQAALLLSWYCDRLEDVVSNSWYWVGIASRTAFGIGVHRDVSKSRLTASIKCHWIRLWWTLYQFDVMVSAAHGRVQAIDLDQSDVVALEAKHFAGVDAPPDFVIHHTQVCMILSRAMKGVTRLRASEADRAAAREQADAELASFYTNLPESLQAASYETADIRVCMLHLSYHYSLLLLHRPSPVPDERETTVEDARICSDAATAVTAIFDSLRRRRMLGGLWIPSAYVLFATLVHVCTAMQSPNPVVAASSRRLFGQLTDTLQALTAKWLFARSLLLVFKRGLSRGLGVLPGKSSAESAQSEDGENEDVGVGVGVGIDTMRPPNGPLEASSIHISGNGPRPWWMQDQDQDATQTMALPPLSSSSLDPATGYAGTAFPDPANHHHHQPLDGSANNMSLDFELFLAGLGTGDDASHDFSRI